MIKLTFFIFFIIGCSRLETINKSIVNHRAMNPKERLSGSLNNRVTILNGNSLGSQAGCATCAK